MNGGLKFFVMAAAITVIALSGNAYALPISSITTDMAVRITDGSYGTTNGGEFNLDFGADGTNDFISFCLETDEYINLGGTFYVQSVGDTALAGGANTNSGDQVSDATRWVFWKYLTGYFGAYSNSLADEVQQTIWWLEDEYATTTTTISNFMSRWGIVKGQAYDVFYNVQVVNLRYGDGRLAQSQLIAEPVPEPATMLLLGSGLVGLAGVARKKARRR